MIIDQWGFYDPGYFPEDINDLELIDLAEILFISTYKWPQDDPIFEKGLIFRPILPVLELKTAHSTLFWLDSVFSYLL